MDTLLGGNVSTCPPPERLISSTAKNSEEIQEIESTNSGQNTVASSSKSGHKRKGPIWFQEYVKRRECERNEDIERESKKWEEFKELEIRKIRAFEQFNQVVFNLIMLTDNNNNKK